MLTPSMLANLNSERQFNINSPLNTQTTLKLVLHRAVHSDAWEGSCRYGDLENLTYEAEMSGLKRGLESAKTRVAELDVPRGLKFLEPVAMYSYAEAGNPDIVISSDQVESLAKEDHKVDVYVTTHMFPGLKIAERYKKPVVIMQSAGWAVDMPARLRYMGLEGYHVHDFDELMRLGILLNARKAFANTKLLNVTNFFFRMPWGCISSAVTDMDKIKDHYGFSYKFVDYAEFFGDMDNVLKDKAVARQKSKVARELFNYARNNNMTRENIENSLNFYYAVQASLEKHECNAFTIECHELCCSLQPWDRKFTPCLNHALLKDTGFPAACEGDVNALMAMMLEMYISNKAVYMGNPFFNRDENILKLKHSVASLKMNGLDTENTSYDIHSFARSGFGATLRHDFTKFEGASCTVARFDPSGMKVLVTSGEVVGGGGMEGCGCDQNVLIRVPDCYELWRSSQNYGHHMAFVYGDYTQEIRDLGDIMKMDVELIG